MKQIFIYICAIVLLLASTVGIYLYQQQRIEDLQSENAALKEDLDAAKSASDAIKDDDPTSYASEKGVDIVVTSPGSGNMISSPLTVTGSVPGTWAFEAQFVVRLLAEDGSTLAEEPATLEGDWMTEDMVPFSATLNFVAPEAPIGSLVLEKANPSDLPENNDSLTIPVQF